MKPCRLPPHQLHRFYAGGPAIADFRGIPATDDHAPEDWVGSTTTLFGQEQLGLSVLEDGRLVREAVAADPEGFLGAEHLARYGTDPALLVKLLDAGERLPVHCHPDRAFSERHLGMAFGKTEAWIVIGTRGAEPTVHLGFRDDVDERTLAGWVQTQDAQALVGALHSMRVSEGDVVLVPAGMPHAIGQGILIVELQEPTDLSVLLEWEGFEVDGVRDGHLGLGFDVALGAVDRSGWSRDALDELRLGRGSTALLPDAADPFFRAERLGGGAELDPGFSILVALAGRGHLGSLPLEAGETALLPHGAGPLSLVGDLEVLRCRPPEAAA